MRDVLRDATHAVRFLLRSPAFAMPAILTIAVGLGPTTAVFSLVNGILVRPLPYEDSDRLVRVIERVDERATPAGVRQRARAGALELTEVDVVRSAAPAGATC